jgi:hypothetical protein
MGPITVRTTPVITIMARGSRHLKSVSGIDPYRSFYILQGSDTSIISQIIPSLQKRAYMYRVAFHRTA